MIYSALFGIGKIILKETGIGLTVSCRRRVSRVESSIGTSRGEAGARSSSRKLAEWPDATAELS